MINYYEILNVPNFCGIEQIKESYKYLVIKNHPDKGGNNEMFLKIKEAYDVLKDSECKKKYDNEFLYYLDIYERAEDVYINDNDKDFECGQCGYKNKIDIGKIDKNKNNIYKCDNCSMIYKINIK